MQRSIRRSHYSGPAPCLVLMPMDCAISQTRYLTLVSFHCVVQPPFSCQIPKVSAAHWLTPTPAFSAQMRTDRVGSWIVLTSVTTDSGNQEELHYIIGSHRWSIIQWWTSTGRYFKQESGVLNISSRVMRCGSRGEEGVSRVLEIVSMVGRQGEYMHGLGGVFLIQRQHLGFCSARTQFAWHHLSVLIHRLNS